MEELGKKQENNMLYCDNESSIHLANNLVFHSKTKDIQLRYHFIRFVLEDGHLKLEKIRTSQNLAYILTKGVTREKPSSFSVSVGRQHEGEDEKFVRSKVEYSPSGTTAVDLL